MKSTFAIIGCGLTGTSAFCQFICNLQEKAAPSEGRCSDIRIVIIEKQDRFGPGFPHSNKFVMPCHMVNTCPEDMGIFSWNPRDFQDWLEAEFHRLAPRFTPFLDDRAPAADFCTYYPRAVVGEYLKTRFMESVESARRLGCEVVLYPRCEALDAAEKGKKVTLLLKALESGRTFYLEADRVLLATGHWFEDTIDNRYVSCPWPAWELLKRIPPGEKVAVLGTSLSALDAVLTLTSEGEFYRDPFGELKYKVLFPARKIVLCSRRGILPKVRGKSGDYRNQFLTQQTLRDLGEGCGQGPALEDIFCLLRSDLEAVYGHPIPWAEVMNPSLPPFDILEQDLRKAKEGDGPQGELLWQTVLHQSFFMARQMYQHLSAGDKENFERRYSTLFFSYAAPMPPVVAEKLLALMKSGIVEVIKLGNAYTVRRDNEDKSFELSYLDARGKTTKDQYAYLINAQGQTRSFATSPSELARNLLRSGMVQIERIPTGRRDESAAGGCDDGLYNSGSLWIDPETHRVLRMKPDGKVEPSVCMHAVGIMTRGQILDASTARGSAVATAIVTAQWALDRWTTEKEGVSCI